MRALPLADALLHDAGVVRHAVDLSGLIVVERVCSDVLKFTVARHSYRP